MLDPRTFDRRMTVDTSEGQPVYLWVGDNGAYLRLSAATYQLLRQVSLGVSFERLAEVMNQNNRTRTVSASEVQQAYQRAADRIAEIEKNAAKPKGAFWFRTPLIPAEYVARAAAIGSALFRPGIAGVLIALIVFCAGVGTAAAAAAPASTPITETALARFWPSYLFFLLSLFAHELGHASACARYGAKPSEIGLTVYFIYPSFYSDVTAAWTLRRWQRVIVDLGGVYFQLIFAAGCALVYFATGWEPLAGTLLLIAGSCLFSLNPILKFDGYWAVADTLGVTNLAAQPMRIFRYLRSRAAGQPVKSLPWSPKITAAVTIYSAAAAIFWIGFLFKLVPWVGTEALHLAERTPALFDTPDATFVRDFATSAFMMLFPAIMLLRLFRSLARSVFEIRGRHR